MSDFIAVDQLLYCSVALLILRALIFLSVYVTSGLATCISHCTATLCLYNKQRT